ncbi:MAG: PilZ domain-containing protein [Desulfosoma sp.]|uniref:PilZ domain-containing protein n=1 Tax=Desulfosoma sp. TaxID=2603217 RepID=UPI00404A6D62
MKNREYLRVRIPELAVWYNELPVGSSPPFFLGFGERTKPSVEREGMADDPVVSVILESLGKLESKVDRILGYLERQGALKPAHAYQGQVVDISGGGLSFSTLHLHAVGAYLELCLMPRVGNPRPIYAVGKICWVEPSSESSGLQAHHVGVRFVEIDEADRQAIIRLVFHMQRREKEQRGSETLFHDGEREPGQGDGDPCRKDGAVKE